MAAKIPAQKTAETAPEALAEDAGTPVPESAPEAAGDPVRTLRFDGHEAQIFMALGGEVRPDQLITLDASSPLADQLLARGDFTEVDVASA